MSRQSKAAVTLADLQKSRELYADGPTGNTYKIRPMNMERYALAGGLPSQLRALAMKGADGINSVLQSSEEDLEESGKAVREYMDGLVRQLLVEPSIPEDVDLDVLPPADYKWLVNIALGEEDRDGQGRRLWGREPLSLWGTFRAEHGCDEGCPSCQRMVASVADFQ